MKHLGFAILLLVAAGGFFSSASAQGEQPSPILVEMRDATVAEVVQALAQGFSVSIGLGQGIDPDARVSIYAQEKTPDGILEMLARQLTGVELEVSAPGQYVLRKKEEGIFTVQPPRDTTAETPVPVAVREREVQPEQDQYAGILPENLMLAKVGIRFSDATEIAGLFGGASYGSRGYGGYGSQGGYGGGGYGGGQYGGGYGGGQYGGGYGGRGGQYGGGQYGGGQYGGGQYGGGQYGGGQYGGGQYGGGQYGGGQYGGGYPGRQF